MYRSKNENFDDDSVALSVRAAQRFHQFRQVPDPLDRKDCRKRPDLLAAAVRQRVLRGEEWGSPRVIISPKLTGGNRILIVLDPLAEVFFREKGDRLLAVDGELSDNVLHARTTRYAGSAWRIRSWHERHPQWKQLKSVSRRPSIGSGILDVKDHYPTISNEVLADLLRSCGISIASVQQLVQSLESLQAMPGIPSGLPVDMELSALLGTAALLPLDCLLLKEDIQFHRWVDDLILLGISEEQFTDLLGRIRGILGAGGQHLNDQKSHWVGSPQPMQMYGAEPSSDLTQEDAVDVLRQAVRSDDFRDAAKAFGALRNASAKIGLDLIAKYPILWFKAPHASGKYLRKMSSAPVADQWEPLAELLPQDVVDSERELATMHLARCFPHHLLSEQVQRRAWDWCVNEGAESAPMVASFVVDLVLRDVRRRQTKRLRSEALEWVDETLDFGLRRVLVGSFRYGGKPAEREANRLQELGRCDPDLACTVEWVLAA